MYNCPSCRHATISGTKKWWSNIAHAECPKCQIWCQVPATSANGILAVTIALFVFSAVGMAYTQSVLVGVLGFVVLIATYVWFWHRAVLIPVSKERALVEKKLGIVGVVVYGILSIFR